MIHLLYQLSSTIPVPLKPWLMTPLGNLIYLTNKLCPSSLVNSTPTVLQFMVKLSPNQWHFFVHDLYATRTAVTGGYVCIHKLHYNTLQLMDLYLLQLPNWPPGISLLTILGRFLYFLRFLVELEESEGSRGVNLEVWSFPKFRILLPFPTIARSSVN